MELDELDYNILENLKKNSRTPFTEIGKDFGVSDATVHVRVNKMLEEGVIKRFTVEVDEDALGKKVHSFVLINVQSGYLEDVANQLMKWEAISAVYEIHGPNDLIMKLEADSLDEIRELMLKIREIPKVVTSELTTILKIWKERKV